MKGAFGTISLRRISPSEKRLADMRSAILRQSAAYYKLPLEFLELETAREILGEVFNTTPSDVDEMIQQRITEKRHCDETVPISVQEFKPICKWIAGSEKFAVLSQLQVARSHKTVE